MKAARPVRWGVVGKGLRHRYHSKGRPIGQVWDKKRYLVGYLPNFTSYRVGYASAMSYIFFVIILAISVLLFVVLNRRGGNA